MACKSCREERKEHVAAATLCLKCCRPVCEDVVACRGCGYDRKKVQVAMGENCLAIVRVCRPVFMKEQLESDFSQRPFGFAGSLPVPPPLVYVQDLDDHLGLPLPKAQARELLALGNSENPGVVLEGSHLRLETQAWDVALDSLINCQIRDRLKLDAGVKHTDTRAHARSHTRTLAHTHAHAHSHAHPHARREAAKEWAQTEVCDAGQNAASAKSSGVFQSILRALPTTSPKGAMLEASCGCL